MTKRKLAKITSLILIIAMVMGVVPMGILGTKTEIKASVQGITNGATYKIVSAYNGKAITQTDVSNYYANCVVWNTDAMSDLARWKVEESGDYYTITNVVTNNSMKTTGNNSGDTLDLNGNDGADRYKWKLVPITSGKYAGCFFIVSAVKNDNGEEEYAEIISDDDKRDLDGAQVRLWTKVTSIDYEPRQIWKFERSDAEYTGFTEEMNDIMVNAFKNQFYKVNSATGYLAPDTDDRFWGMAEMMESFLDGYETTGKTVYKDMFVTTYEDFIATNGEDWAWKDWNDDIAWGVIASIRGYLILGDERYLTLGKQNFDMMFKRANNRSDGMLIWKMNHENDDTTSCINGPAIVAACYLAQATNDDSYYTKAKNLYNAWRNSTLYEREGDEIGHVWDTMWEYWCSTYNQGTFIGSALMLYERYGDESYYEDACNAVNHVFKALCYNNILIKEDANNADNSKMRGILMRYLRKFIVDFNNPQYLSFFKDNAKIAWMNRNSKNIQQCTWNKKTPENVNWYSHVSYNAISLMANMPTYADELERNAYAKIEGEDMDYTVGGLISEDNSQSSNGRQLGGIKNGNYTAYYNVNFGATGASKIKLRYSRKTEDNTSGTVEVRLGGANGTLIAKATLENTGTWNDWKEITVDTARVTGLQNIYVIFKSSTEHVCNFDYFTFEQADISNQGYMLIMCESNTRYAQLKNGTIDNTVLARSTSRGDWEQFQIVINDDQTISLKAPITGKYVRVAYGSNGFYITANGDSINNESKFVIEKLSDDTTNMQVSIKSVHTGKYLTVDANDSEYYILANSETVTGAAETFHFVTANGETILPEGVILKAPEVTTPAKVPGLTYAGNETLAFYFAWQGVAGANGYNVYLDGKLITKVDGVTYEFSKDLFAEAREYTIEVAAVNEAGEGIKTEYKYTVESKEPDSTKNDYTINYYQQNTQGTYDIVAKDTVNRTGTIGAEIIAPEKNYTGFIRNETKSTVKGNIAADGSLVLSVYYDRKTYSIAYQGIEGISNARDLPDDFIYGVSKDLVSPVKTGYTFAGWYKEAAYTNQVTELPVNVASNVTLYAKFTPNTNTAYKVEHYQQNTDLDTYTMIDTDDLIGPTASEAIARSKEYNGFYVNEEKSIKTGTIAADGSLVLKVYYDRKNYNIVYRGIEGISNENALPVTYVYGIGKALVQATKERHTFGGWYQESTFENRVTAISVEQMGTITLYAKFTELTEAVTEADYTVNYYRQNLQGGYEIVASDTVSKTGTIGERVYAPEKNYAGFVQNETISKVAGTIAADGSLVLNVYYDRNEYTITYHEIEGINNEAALPKSFLYGEGKALVEAEKTGYTFDGWYTDAACQNRITEIEVSQTDGIDLYAKFTKIEEEKKKAGYRVEYYKQDISLTGYELVENDTVVAEAETDTEVQAPEKFYEGFAKNREISAENGIVVQDGTLVLKVYFDREVYTINYVGVEGCSNEADLPTEYVFGIGMTALFIPVKSGFIFEGWYTDAEYNNKIEAISTQSRENLICYAKFEQENTSGDNEEEQGGEEPGGEEPGGTEPGGEVPNGGQTGGTDNKPSDTGNSGTNNISKTVIEVGKTFVFGKFRYKVKTIGQSTGTLELVKSLKTTNKKLTIPKTVKYLGITFTVTSIGKNAFKNNKKLTSVTIGQEITSIGSKAFYGCVKLTRVTIKSKKLKKVGAKAFIKTSSKLKVKAGSKKNVKKCKTLLKKKLPKTAKIVR